MTIIENRADGEIELVDYLRIIWKWKYLVLIGTMIITTAIGITSYNSTEKQIFQTTFT